MMGDRIGPSREQSCLMRCAPSWDCNRRLRIVLMMTRRATVNDLELLAPLLDQWRITRERLYPKSPIEDSAWITIADGKAVGWLQGHHRQTEIWKRVVGYQDKPEGWSCSFPDLMFVDPSYRMRGIGSQLLAAFEQEARESGTSLVLLNPSTADSDTLNAFYERNGYTVRAGYRGNPTYLLGKDL